MQTLCLKINIDQDFSTLDPRHILCSEGAIRRQLQAMAFAGVFTT
jgi:hypothetical protein